jgi:hypothetical protein
VQFVARVSRHPGPPGPAARWSPLRPLREDDEEDAADSPAQQDEGPMYSAIVSFSILIAETHASVVLLGNDFG